MYNNVFYNSNQQFSVITNCLDNWKGYESKCYKVENRDDKITWTAAQEQCQSLGKSS